MISTSSAVAAQPSESDLEIEAFLRRSRVVEAREIGSGVTRPLKLVLEHDGRTLEAAFQTVAVRKRGRSHQPGFPPEPEFTDDYRYERAAYVVDRELGLDMVPVTVLRKWQGRPGAASRWVADAIDGKERRDRQLEPPDPWPLRRQVAAMRLFDALILNTDRNLTNELITHADWKLHLIDHSRSFRRAHDLPDRFKILPAKLPRELFERLQALDEERLLRALRGVIERFRIGALMARRDLILEKVERDRATYGDAAVFSFGEGEPPP